MLLPFLGRKATETNANKVLTVLVTKGNAKEVFLKCNEALRTIEWQPQDDAGPHEEGEANVAEALNAISKEQEGQEIDPVKQVVAICRATDIGNLSFRVINVSIQTNPNELSCAVFDEFCRCLVTLRDPRFSIRSGTRGLDDAT